MIYKAIQDLLCYGILRELIDPQDVVCSMNSLLSLLQIDDPGVELSDAVRHIDTLHPCTSSDLCEILDVFCDYAEEKGIIPAGSITMRDLFDTKVMGILTDRPSHVTDRFFREYHHSPEASTDWFYRFSQDTNYIRRDRIKKDLKWKTQTPYGLLDITINLSKPEKDPAAIAAAGKAKSSSYPKCALCMENEGYAGRINHPARQNHRLIPLTIAGGNWYLQYSPYVYYNEHCIVLNGNHVPMVIEKRVFSALFDFLDQFPHYFIGSNADLPIVGGSILSHEHFQGGHYSFAMEQAPLLKSVHFHGFDDIEAGIVRWPLSVIRLTGKDRRRVEDLADIILHAWRNYSDEESQLIAYTDNTPHNTITPIARRQGDAYQLDLVLRNNRTTEESPLGIFHPRASYHHIKKENIGLIEVMGLAVLPSRLSAEITGLKQALLTGKDISEDKTLASHADWLHDIRQKYSGFSEENVDDILRDEIGLVFMRVLEDCGIYKNTDEGHMAFMRFIGHINSML